MLDGYWPKNVKLRQAGSGLRRLWDVELVIRYGHMYLCRGWEQFYRAYDLRHGYFLVFRYDGDTMLTVKVFNTTMCRMRYQDDDDATKAAATLAATKVAARMIQNGVGKKRSRVGMRRCRLTMGN
nr:B3 domain-containing protein Os03g0212300-like [Aegilops tauschii subsp. strangulata]